MNGKLKEILLPAAALFASVFVVYYTALGYGYVYDDVEQILGNRWILSFSNLPEAFTTHTFGFKEVSYQAISYRPMMYVIYMAEYALFGFTPWGWHLVNILVHAFNSVLVFLILKHILGSERQASGKVLPAFAAALIFALHPMNAEPVSWLATVPELFFTALCLAGFYLEARSIDGVRRSALEAIPARVVPAFFFLAAVLLKETAVVLPVIVFVYDVSRKGLRGIFSAERILRFVPYAIAAAVYAGMRVWALKGEITPTEKLHSFLSPYDFILNAVVLLARYFKALVLPIGEPPLQLMDPVFSLAEPRAMISLAVVIAVPAVLALVLRRITRLWVLILAIMILPILPTLYSPAVSRFPFADRYLYFPSAGLAMLLSVVMALAMSKNRRWGLWAVAALLLISGPSAVLARGKSVAWESNRTLWSAALEAQPGNYVAIYAIARERLLDGNAGEAVTMLERSLAMNLSSPHPDESMVILTRQTLPQACFRAGLEDKAEAHLEEYLKLMPDDAAALYNLGFLKQKKGGCAGAMDLYQKATVFSRDPGLSARAYANLGECYLASGMKGEALSSFREALTHAPGDQAVLGRIEALGAPAR